MMNKLSCLGIVQLNETNYVLRSYHNQYFDMITHSSDLTFFHN